MAGKKRKFGKMTSFYLSLEAIDRLNGLTLNKSAFIEQLINTEYEKQRKKLETESL